MKILRRGEAFTAEIRLSDEEREGIRLALREALRTALERRWSALREAEGRMDEDSGACWLATRESA